jgi:alkylation response protein AidB-like acyl-CoA dehydrogenase
MSTHESPHPMTEVDRHHAFREQARVALRAASDAIGWVPGDGDPAELDIQHRFHKELTALGWGALAWPAEFGGGSRTLEEQAIFAEEAARMRVPHQYNRVAMGIAGPAIMLFGTDEHKARFLPAILSGDEIWCQGFSEPNAGSDLAGLRTRAELGDDGCWRVTGQKVWTTLASAADHCLLLARTAPDRHRGITAFLMPMRQKEVEARPIRQINGADDFCEVFLDGARVNPDLVLGKLNEGWIVAMRALEYERSVHLVHRQVSLEAMIDSLVCLVADSPQQLGWVDAVMRFKVIAAQMKHSVQAQLRAIDAGERPDLRANMTKLLWSETYQDVTRLAVDIAAATRGQSGLKTWLREYYGSLATTIYAGTSEIQRNIIAERALGLPR